jgi:hypothetical protein
MMEAICVCNDERILFSLLNGDHAQKVYGPLEIYEVEFVRFMTQALRLSPLGGGHLGWTHRF